MYQPIPNTCSVAIILFFLPLKIYWAIKFCWMDRCPNNPLQKDFFNHLKKHFSSWVTLLLLLSRFSRVQLCATPETAAHQVPLPLGFSRQEHWSGLPFPSSMQESEKWKWSCSVVSDSSRPTRLLHPWDFPGKSTGVGCHCLLHRVIVKIKWKYFTKINKY